MARRSAGSAPAMKDCQPRLPTAAGRLINPTSATKTAASRPGASQGTRARRTKNARLARMKAAVTRCLRGKRSMKRPPGTRATKFMMAGSDDSRPSCTLVAPDRTAKMPKKGWARWRESTWNSPLRLL